MARPTNHEIAKAATHPTRLFILEQADGKRMAPSDIAALLDESTPAMTHHFTVLSQAGLIKRAGSQKVGATVKTFWRSDGWVQKLRDALPDRVFEDDEGSHGEE